MLSVDALNMPAAWEDFFDSTCALMDIVPATAELGYKFPDDLISSVPTRLSTRFDYEMAIAHHRFLCLRTRVKLIVMRVFNLVSQSFIQLPTHQMMSICIRRTSSPLGRPQA